MFQRLQRQLGVVQIAAAGRDQRLHGPAARQEFPELALLGEVVEHEQGREPSPEGVPELLGLLGFGQLTVDLDSRGGGHEGDHGAETLVGLDPPDAAGVEVAEAADVFDGKLRLAQPARAGDDADARDDGDVLVEEQVVEFPKRLDAADEAVAHRAQRHAAARR